MQIKTANFLSSNADYKKCPPPVLPEYAFIGRSNVGKSSLINMLTNRTGLARISATPGKTQTINHFVINEEWYLVDLPGYGWARVSKTQRDKFQLMIEKYLQQRENLRCTFVLIDIRLEPQTNDMDFMRWMGTHGLPFAIIFTKADKLSKPAAQKNVAHYRRVMLQYWEEMPPFFLTSSETREGREDVLALINKLNSQK